MATVKNNVIEMAISVSDCCKADLVRRMGSPSGWECSKCKLTCSSIPKEKK